MDTKSELPSPFFDLLHLDICYPIARRIYHFLEIADIIAISRTCRSLSNAYSSLLPLEWDVDRVLSRFVSDPKRFRAQMAKHNVLVGGSVPLQFFERVVWAEECLLLYDLEDPAEDSMEKFLRDKEGYEFADEWRDEIGISHESFVRVGMRKNGHFPTTSGITIREGKWAPTSTLLNFAHTNLFTNCFSWNKAYSIFPQKTFVHRKAVVIEGCLNHGYTGSDEVRLKKYERRGWKLQCRAPLERVDDQASDPSPSCSRRIGDRYVWTIPFDIKGIECREANPNYVIEHSSFSVWSHLAGLDYSAPESDFTKFAALPFTAEVLRYRYTVGADGWSTWIRKVMTYKTLEELHRLPRAARPATFDRMIEDPRFIVYSFEDFEKPDTWRFCDDEIPELYKEWQSTLCHPLP